VLADELLALYEHPAGATAPLQVRLPYGRWAG
jgi:hypothetical protein